MPATNFVTDKRRSSRKKSKMALRHDDQTSAEVRHLANPYDDWDESLNKRLLAKIESDHPPSESIEEEEDGEESAKSEYFPVPAAGGKASPLAGAAAGPAATKSSDDSHELRRQDFSGSNQSTMKAEKFAITAEGKFDHVFQDAIKQQLTSIIRNHVRSEQIDCDDRSMYTGLPGVSLLYHHLSTKQALDSRLRDDLAAKASHHINQYLTSIKTQHMHNSKCLSFLCGELGVFTFCALARNQQKLHRELLTRTLSYPGPGPTLSQSAPTTPGVLSSELAASQAGRHHHPPSSGVEQIISEPDTSVLLEKILELVKMQEQAGTPDELLYGRTGGLYAMLLIKQQLPKQTVIKDEHISNHVNLILKSGQSMESYGRPLFYSWHGKEYVGAAHGYAGILYMLLEAHKYLNEDQLKLVREAINFVQGVKYPSCNYPSSIGGQTDRLVHWCHGAPGVVHMLIKAFLVYQDDSYLKSALDCGELIWQRGLLKKGFSLCHGISGNAYAFLHLFQLTKDPRHLYRAGKFCQFYFEHNNSISWRADSPASLFEGYAGLAYFLADLLNPNEAKFPAFQLSTATAVN